MNTNLTTNNELEMNINLPMNVNMKITIKNITLCFSNTNENVHNEFLCNKLKEDHIFIKMLEKTFNDSTTTTTTTTGGIKYIYKKYLTHYKYHKFYNIKIDKEFLLHVIKNNSNDEDCNDSNENSNNDNYNSHLIPDDFVLYTKKLTGEDLHYLLNENIIREIYRDNYNHSIIENNDNSNTIEFIYYLYYNENTSSIDYYISFRLPNNEYIREFMNKKLEISHEIIDEILLYKRDRFKSVKGIIDSN